MLARPKESQWQFSKWLRNQPLKEFFPRCQLLRKIFEEKTKK